MIMSKKKLNQFISNFIMFTFLFSAFVNNCVYATGTAADPILVNITEVLLVVAGLVCVGKIIHIGIKFMMTSVEEKSNAKMALLPWLVGTIVCFGAAWIGRTIISIFNIDKNVLDY